MAWSLVAGFSYLIVEWLATSKAGILLFQSFSLQINKSKSVSQISVQTLYPQDLANYASTIHFFQVDSTKGKSTTTVLLVIGGFWWANLGDVTKILEAVGLAICMTQPGFVRITKYKLLVTPLVQSHRNLG
ncbi:hypothetical protein CONCODRAFT_3869 [Conidiobolus coronatus NRRL 28638]|uniref:Uncharacterized protein n=1 Tax=Conidiobolus coronatus (strain ATCC 28846 / CBS 209.66 / NRRL 28638) TaxID=796925 RepID=A0A137PE37_CONC2|nr:hypothetical protein CONCODRAFT_3869 [Conidiobolus coronatus NRRL 28638]|eukprot:KXN73201.1 hypothetical protein CONCODRAFT_3869 [Conidiobolus coronatus NRRL 28638]